MENNVDNLNENRCKNPQEYNHNLISFRTTLTPLYLSINDKENFEYTTKCSSMVLDFNDVPQDVNEIHFTNYYTYTVSILIMRISNTDPKRLKKWYMAIKQKVR